VFYGANVEIGAPLVIGAPSVIALWIDDEDVIRSDEKTLS
jgi:hypothetical protein